MKIVVLLLVGAMVLAEPLSDGEKYDLAVAVKEKDYAVEFNRWCELKKQMLTGPKRSEVEKEQWKVVLQKERELELVVGSYE